MPRKTIALNNTDGVANSYLFIYAAGSRSDTDSPWASLALTLVGPSPSPLTPTPNLLNLRRGRLLKTMHALFLHVGISEKVSYDLCTLAWPIVVVRHKAIWRAPHTPHPTPHASPQPRTTTSTAPHHTL